MTTIAAQPPKSTVAPACENFWINDSGTRQTCDQQATQGVLDCGFITNVCADCAAAISGQPVAPRSVDAYGRTWGWTG